MESKACLTFSVVGGSHFPAHVFKVAFRFFFVRTVLIQDPAHINNFTFPAMASNRLLVCLVRVCLHAHERARLWSQSGGSHNSDSERWLTSPCWMHTRNNHLPRAAARVDGQRYHRPAQSVLISRMIQLWHCQWLLGDCLTALSVSCECPLRRVPTAPCSGPGRWSEISQTRTVSADITYDTALALPVTAGWLPNCLKCQLRVPTAPGKTSKQYRMSHRTSPHRKRRRTVLSYVSADIHVRHRIIPM